MDVLIVGGSGFLGSELVRQAVAAGHTTAATFATRPRSTSPDVREYALDLRDSARLDAVLTETTPALVVNATSGGPDWQVTAEGPVRLAMAAAKYGFRLVRVSTDAVFSGSRVTYDETCLPDPVTPYGAAKAAAETGIRLTAPDAVVARTSLIIGGGWSAHERAVHDLAAGKAAGVLFTDDIRCPVHVSPTWPPPSWSSGTPAHTGFTISPEPTPSAVMLSVFSSLSATDSTLHGCRRAFGPRARFPGRSTSVSTAASRSETSPPGCAAPVSSSLPETEATAPAPPCRPRPAQSLPTNPSDAHFADGRDNSPYCAHPSAARRLDAGRHQRRERGGCGAAGKGSRGAAARSGTRPILSG